jgi:folate-binding protein YgfZ
MIQAVSREASNAYKAARQRSGIVDRSDRGRIVVSGKDRATYLHGLLTNDIAGLTAGKGCYAAYLTPQGRMVADLWLYELGDVILVTLWRDVKDAVLARLDQFIFTEDVQLGDVSDTFASLAVVGPHSAEAAAAVLNGATRDSLAALGEHDNLRARFGDQPVIVASVTDVGEPGYELSVDAAQRGPLGAALERSGAVVIDPDVAETLRIEAGIPKFHRDMDEDTIPLEAGIESRAISLTKGCYVGQEVIIRVLHRGHGRVARKLVGLTLQADLVPAAGAFVQHEGRNIGRVTSSAMSPALQAPIALAYVHRDFVAPGTSLVVDGASAVVTALPFVRRPA